MGANVGPKIGDDVMPSNVGHLLDRAADVDDADASEGRGRKASTSEPHHRTAADGVRCVDVQSIREGGGVVMAGANSSERRHRCCSRRPTASTRFERTRCAWVRGPPPLWCP